MIRRFSPSLLAFMPALCLVVGISRPALGEETGLELIINAAKHSGDRQIRTGEFTYTRHSITDPPTAEAIKLRVDENRARLLKMLEETKNEKVKKSLQKGLDQLENSLSVQMKWNADKKFTYDYALRDAASGGDRYFQFTPMYPPPEASGGTDVLLTRSLNGATTSLHQMGAGKMTIAQSTGAYAGLEPQRLGRLLGLLVERPPTNEDEIKRYLEETVSEAESVRLDDDRPSNTRKVTCWFEGPGAPRTQITLHVDPLRDYVTPLIRESDAEGNVLREWISEDYFQPEGSPLWFPQKFTFRETARKIPGNGNRTDRYTFAKNGVSLNGKIPDERFTVVLQRNSTLLDNLSGKNISYNAKDELKLSLDALDDLASVQGLEGPKQ